MFGIRRAGRRNCMVFGRRYFGNEPAAPPPENPVSRTLRILKQDVKSLKKYLPFSSKTEDDLNINVGNWPEGKQEVPSHCDVLVIGGAGVGSSVAYWLKKKAGDGLRVVVVEKDCTYCKASTGLSVGGLRQQFSLPENIQMSLFGADFIRNVEEHLGPEVYLNFTPHGYLMLASEEGAQQLQDNSRLQLHLGAKNELLTATALKVKFPWLDTTGIALGCHGLENEGWFDPWALLYGLKRSALVMGAEYVTGEAVGFEFKAMPDILMDGIEDGSYQALDRVLVKTDDGSVQPIKFALCVIAAGADSGAVARLAKIGTGTGMLSIPLPVEPRKRYVYSFDCQSANPPGLNAPLTVDPTNTYFRRDGLAGRYIAGRSPLPSEEPSTDNLDVDLEYFDEHVWPTLAKRVPSFEAIKVKSAWAGFYEYNTYDENGIVGPHPYYNNLYIATGFSGHGIQQVPAVGRAISEMILDGDFNTIDLTRLGFDRLILQKPMLESNIV